MGLALHMKEKIESLLLQGSSITPLMSRKGIPLSSSSFCELFKPFHVLRARRGAEKIKLFAFKEHLPYSPMPSAN
jgi:hypothetical protein